MCHAHHSVVCVNRSDVKKAGLCLQTRVAKAEKAASQGLSPNGYNPEPWYSYGMFNLRQSDFAKANECFREAIAIDAKHIPSLQALGSLSSQLGDGNTATTLLTAALQLATPQSPSAALINILLAVVAERYVKELRYCFLLCFDRSLYCPAGLVMWSSRLLVFLLLCLHFGPLVLHSSNLLLVIPRLTP